METRPDCPRFINARYERVGRSSAAEEFASIEPDCNVHQL